MPGPTLELTQLLTDRMVRAGAGAGKTTRLSRRVIDVAKTFYDVHGKLPRVLVTTFTRKATQELKERLVKNACESHNPHMLQFVSSPSNLHVSTIHGVLALFLRRYGHLFNLDPGFQLVDESQARQLKRGVFRDTLAADPEAMELLEFFSSGELLDILALIDLHRLQNGTAEPWSEADLHAALDRKKKKVIADGLLIWSSIIAESSDSKWIEHGETSKKVLKFAETDSKMTFAFLEDSLKFKNKPKFSTDDPPFAPELRAELEKWTKALDKINKSSAYSDEQFILVGRLHEIIQRLSLVFTEKLKEQKRKKNLFEMSDIENVVIELLNLEPDIARSFAADWDYALTDEYQDTSPLQVRILNELLHKTPQYYVGDPQQSIYLFRGARSEVFFEKQNEIKGNKGEFEELVTNFRSTPTFLKFINHQAGQMGEQFSAMTPPDDALTVDVGAVAIIAPVVNEAEHKYSPIASFIAEEVDKGARFDDFAILTRKNSDNFDIARYLEEHGILCQVHSASGFFQSREVLDALSLLRFLVLPYDIENLVLLLRTPWFKVSDTDLSSWLSEKREVSWEDLASKTHPTIERLKAALAFSSERGVFEVWLDLLKSSGAIDYSCYFDSTGRRESNTWKLISLVAEAQRKPAFNYVQFLDRADNGFVDDDEGEGQAAAIIEPNRVNLMTVHKAKGLKFNVVILPNANKAPRTSLSSRGQSSFVYDENQKKYGISMATEDGESKSMPLPSLEFLESFSEREVEEHKRLYYVAITRAVRQCLITWCGDVEDESWASYLPKYSDDGEFETSDFKYSVRSGPFEVKKIVTEPKLTEDVRKVYRDTSTPLTSGRISVSGLLALLEENQAAAVGSTTKKPEMPKRTAEHQIKLPYFGVRLHSALEKIKYHPEFDFKKEAEQVEDSKAFVSAMNYVLDLKSPNMKALFQSGEVEWGFQVKTRRGILEGQVDMWGFDEDGTLWVVDYKSGDPRYVEKAFRQLELYAYPLLKMLKMKSENSSITNFKVKLATIFPVAKKVEVREARSISEIADEYGL